MSGVSPLVPGDLAGVIHMEQILVTGAGGTVGSALVHELGTRGVRVRAGVHTPADHGSLAGDTVEVVPLELTDPDSAAAAVADVDRVFLLTPGDPETAALSRPLVEAAADEGVDHVVKLSGLGAGDENPIALSRWHRAAEVLIEDAGLTYTHLRPTAFMQNFLGDAASIRAEGTFYTQIGDAAVGYVDARDVAAVAAAVLTEDGHADAAYDLTGPEALTAEGIAATFADELGRDVEAVAVDAAGVRAGMLEAGMDPVVVDAMVELGDLYAAGHGAAVSPAVEAVTGAPGHSFDRFVRDYRGVFA